MELCYIKKMNSLLLQPTYFQYVEELYENSSDFLEVKRRIVSWLVENLGDRDREDSVWAWSFISMRQGCPIGIYFKNEEDRLAFRLKFGILRGSERGRE
jgi:hypothetical protein